MYRYIINFTIVDGIWNVNKWINQGNRARVYSQIILAMISIRNFCFFTYWTTFEWTIKRSKIVTDNRSWYLQRKRIIGSNNYLIMQTTFSRRRRSTTFKQNLILYKWITTTQLPSKFTLKRDLGGINAGL